MNRIHKTSNLVRAGAALLALLFLVAVAGCSPKAQEPKAGAEHAATEGKAKEGEHASASDDAKGRHGEITKADQKAIEQGALAALKQLEKSEGDGAKLGSAMMGDALRDLRRDMARDAAASKIKIRRYGDAKAEWVNYTSGLAGVTVSFVDQGYYVDAVTRKPLNRPSNKDFRFIFTLKKEAGTWKVAQIFESDTARGGDPKTKQDGTINKGTRVTH